MIAVQAFPGHAHAQEGPEASEASPHETRQPTLEPWTENPVVVTPSRRSTTLRQAPAVITVIGRDEIRLMGARNLLDVLKMVPEIGVSIAENGSFLVDARGLRTAFDSGILFLIDGHSVNRNLFGSALYVFAATLPVENIRQIEVVRGPGSAVYGNGAFVATINVITLSAQDINGLAVKGSGGTYRTREGSLVAGRTGGGKGALSGSIDVYHTDGPKLLVQSDSLTGTPYSAAPGTPDLSITQADLFLEGRSGGFLFRGNYDRARLGRYIGPGFALTDKDYLVAENYWAELAYGAGIASFLDATLRLSVDHYKQEPYYKLRPNGFNGAFPYGMVTRPLAQDTTLGTEVQTEWRLFGGNHLTVGAAYETTWQHHVRQLSNFDPQTGADLVQFRSVTNFSRNVNRRIWAAFAEDEWQVGPLSLTAGVRADHYSDFGFTVNPRAGAVWNVVDVLDLKALYGRAFRAPSFTELYSTGVNGSRAGNPHLRPERIETWEAVMIARPLAHLGFQVSYFHSSLWNQIAGQGAPSAPYANLGKAETQGVATEVTLRLFGDFFGRLNYGYQRPRDSLSGARLPYVPQHRASGRLTYVRPGIAAAHVDVLWTGARPRETGDTRSAISAFTTVDVAVTVFEVWRRIEAQVAIHDLLNREITDPDTSGAFRFIPGDFPREGLSAVASLRLKWDLGADPNSHSAR
jgi:iron complex outermembrane receptor protein